MSNLWFRLYGEFATDPKIQMMNESMQRRFIMLLCMRCSNGDVTLQDCEVAFQLRITDEEWSETKSVFIAKGFIDECNNILHWNKRQYVSDSSAERVRKHRESKRSTSKRGCNVTVTPPDTDTDTEVTTGVVTISAPIAAEKKSRHITTSDLERIGVSKQVAADYLDLRKQKRSKLTQTALDGITKEAFRAGMSLEAALRTCIERGWQGFKSEWVTKPPERQTRADAIANACDTIGVGSHYGSNHALSN
ncbi:hypothetical protein [Chromobacterium rhizoryzae]|uniref:DUF1376 domain-containing protein n=1 Tax=Chromobacterium rhizoryzae TaxID=1778675 RepID=A0AAD0RXB4_9NEIS|nr:hypothetical protein [Chromobacterium rhizoryzae]AXT46378.1 hypothetical protein D1345_09340 [Chromobacterium rhizoryzae]